MWVGLTGSLLEFFGEFLQSGDLGGHGSLFPARAACDPVSSDADPTGANGEAAPEGKLVRIAQHCVWEVCLTQFNFVERRFGPATEPTVR